MKPLASEINAAPSAVSCAAEILDVIPLVMQTIRSHMGDHGVVDLSVPQFRTLMFLHDHPEVSISEAAEHIGVALPSMSKLIDGIVARGLLTRSPDPNDRRRQCLALTAAGWALLEKTQESARGYLASTLMKCQEEQRQVILGAIRLLKPIFLPPCGNSNHHPDTKESESSQ